VVKKSHLSAKSSQDYYFSAQPNYKYMVYDLDMIKALYAAMRADCKGAQGCWQPLTLSEKILYSTFTPARFSGFGRGNPTSIFLPTAWRCKMRPPDGVASVYVGGIPKVLVPSTVHCDHLILAKEAL